MRHWYDTNTTQKRVGKRKMKRAIVVASDYRFMSALVDKETASTLKVGDRVRATRNLDIDGSGVVPHGEEGEILSVDAGEMGFVEILFDTPIPALHEWRNVLLLVPFDTPDYIAGLALQTCVEFNYHRPPAPRSQHTTNPRRQLLPLAAALLAALFLAVLVSPDNAQATHGNDVPIDFSVTVP